MAGQTIVQEEEEHIIEEEQQQIQNAEELTEAKYLINAEDAAAIHEAWRRRMRSYNQRILHCINQLKLHMDGSLQNVLLEVNLVGLIEKLYEIMEKSERMVGKAEQEYLNKNELTCKKNNEKKRIIQVDDDDDNTKRTRPIQNSD